MKIFTLPYSLFHNIQKNIDLKVFVLNMNLKFFLICLKKPENQLIINYHLIKTLLNFL